MTTTEDLKLTTGASFHRGSSKQDYQTPMEFIEAVILKFGTPHFDLAADCNNCKAFGPYYTEADNALVRPWHSLRCLCWLNPPYSNIEPWAAKCREESQLGARILFLIPASVGSVWFQTHVHGHAMVYFLRPRLCFDGIAPFPKDCVLAQYSPTIKPGYECWKWK